MKPRAMNAFDYLFMGALIVEIFTVIVGWDWIAMGIHEHVAAQGGGPDMQVFFSGLVPWFIAFDLLLAFALWAFISVFRWSFWRIILAVFVALEVVSLLQEIVDPIGEFWFLASALLSTGLRVAAVVFVFQGEAGAWLRQDRADAAAVFK
ncbi:MAG: hypothetical protein AAF251_05250 [Pseudomonadota bacterium]